MESCMTVCGLHDGVTQKRQLAPDGGKSIASRRYKRESRRVWSIRKLVASRRFASTRTRVVR